MFKATSVAGNAVYGSVFYSMPAICSVSLTLSPLSMLVACLILLLWRGILVELGGAVRLNGGNVSRVSLYHVSRLTLVLTDRVHPAVVYVLAQLFWEGDEFARCGSDPS